MHQRVDKFLYLSFRYLAIWISMALVLSSCQSQFGFSESQPSSSVMNTQARIVNPTATQTVPLAPSRTTPATRTVTPSPTLPVEICISGVVFHDYNGNGVQDLAVPQGTIKDHPLGNLGGEDPILEPAIEGAGIRVSGVEAISDSKGNYSLCFLSGMHVVHIEKNGFRYFFPSNDALVPLSSPFQMAFSTNGVVNFGLGAGPITLPFSLQDKDVHMLGPLVDIDPVSPVIRLFNGVQTQCVKIICDEDTHFGIDYFAVYGTPITAVAPGVITRLSEDEPGSHTIEIEHDFEAFPDERVAENWRTISWKFTSGYSDIGKPLEHLEVGMRVQRGQVLAYQGHYRHTHFFLMLKDPTGRSVFLDPYRDIDFAVLDFFGNQDNRAISQGSPGFWTDDNQSFFSDNAAAKESELLAHPTPTLAPVMETAPIQVDGSSEDWENVDANLIRDIIYDHPGDVDLVSARILMDERYVYFLIQTREPLRAREAAFAISLDTEHGINQVEVEFTPSGTSMRVVKTWMAAPGARIWWGDNFEAKVPRSLFGEAQYLNLGDVLLNYSVDGEWKTDWMYSEPLSGIPTPAPTLTPLPPPQLAIVIDGNPDDWTAIAAEIVKDSVGDHLGSSPDSDLVAARITSDDTYIYLLVETAGDLITGEVELDIELDVRDGAPCSAADVGLSVHPNFMGAWTITGCNPPDPNPVHSSSLAWGKALEIRIVKSELGIVSKVGIVVIHLNMTGPNGWYTPDDLEQ